MYSMKTHKQFCGLSLALSYIGDRWTLLIVRELLTGPKSYSLLLESLNGCSPNSLSSRLKSMALCGFVTLKRDTSGKRFVYSLSDLGLSLREPIESLVRWGGQFISKEVLGFEKKTHWLEIAIPSLLRPKMKKETRYRIQLEVEGHSFALVAGNDNLDTVKGLIRNPDFILKVSYEKALAIASGQLNAKLLARDEITPGTIKKRAHAVKHLEEIVG